MKDDLISRKALRETMYHEAFETDSDMQKWDSGCWIRYKMFENHLKDTPSVPAVPLDKLCKFLGKATHPCILLAIGCPYDESYCEECDSCNAWKTTLTKWMEEQNAAD